VQDFARLFRRLREAKGVTCYWLAQRTGLSQQAVLNLELPNADPKLSTILKLAGALGVNPARLVPGAEVVNPTGPTGPATPKVQSTRPTDARGPASKPAEPIVKSTRLMAAPGADAAGKPGVRDAVVEVYKGDGKWRGDKRLREAVQRVLGREVSSGQLSAALRDIQNHPPRGYALEARHVDDVRQYRIVPRAEATTAAELIAQIRPVLDEIKRELEKSFAAMSTTFMTERVAYIERVFARLPGPTPGAAALIARVRPVLAGMKKELRKSFAAMSTSFLLDRVAHIEQALKSTPLD
jgi:transcriptional regulator with XRE-family HTH domain